MSGLKDLIGLCQGRLVYIQTHDFPDPDAIASAYGLQKLLAACGVESKLCYVGKIDKLSASKMLDAFKIRMLPYESLAADMREEDRIICVDTQKNGGYATDLVGDEVACIDHHPTYVPVRYQYQDIRMVGACATLVAEYFSLSGNEPDRDTATALLYGIKMDTLQFTRGVTDLDIKMFRYLFPYCDQKKLGDLERNNMEFDDLKAYGAAIESIELCGKIGFSYIPFQCPDAMVAILADFILTLVEVEVAVVAASRKSDIRLSVRSEDPDIHAGRLLYTALRDVGGGGGHASMGGGAILKDRIPAYVDQPKDYIKKLILGALGKA